MKWIVLTFVQGYQRGEILKGLPSTRVVMKRISMSRANRKECGNYGEIYQQCGNEKHGG